MKMMMIQCQNVREDGGRPPSSQRLLFLRLRLRLQCYGFETFDPLKSKIDNGDRENVLDGGCLLYLINWNKNEIFADIYKRY